jgi:hypothetical protein
MPLGWNGRDGIQHHGRRGLESDSRRAPRDARTRHAQRYCQTRFLCEKYGLPLPAALTTDQGDDPQTDAT